MNRPLASLFPDAREAPAPSGVAQADLYRQEAAALRRAAEARLRLAETIEVDLGIGAPCHLCGNRDCGH